MQKKDKFNFINILLKNFKNIYKYTCLESILDYLSYLFKCISNI